jgi:broad specificity phosphatase PhoE
LLRIFIARHGQSVDNAAGILGGHRDAPLTAIGEAQAHEAAKLIKAAGLKFDRMFSSPLVRAARTAEIICQDIGGPKPVTMEDLIEKDFGSMTGVEESRVEELCAPDILYTGSVCYFLCPPGAETFPEVLGRARRVLSRLAEEYDNESVLLVSHGDIGKMLYAAYYDLDWKDVLALFHFGNSEVIELSREKLGGEVGKLFSIEQRNL